MVKHWAVGKYWTVVKHFAALDIWAVLEHWSNIGPWSMVEWRCAGTGGSRAAGPGSGLARAPARGGFEGGAKMLGRVPMRHAHAGCEECAPDRFGPGPDRVARRITSPMLGRISVQRSRPGPGLRVRVAVETAHLPRGRAGHGCNGRIMVQQRAATAGSWCSTCGCHTPCKPGAEVRLRADLHRPLAPSLPTVIAC